MAETTESPHWDRLPHDPAGFFDLEGDYDRKDLKRRYNRLLRQFKPEKNPEEFQRIRAAYEDLDNQLRYGNRFSTQAAPREWVTQFPTVVAAADSTSPAAEPTVLESFQSQSSKEIYERLRKKQTKTAYDYFALALIADSLSSDALLLNWVLAGLKEFPNDYGLYRLLYEFFRGGHLQQAPDKVLLAVSEVVRKDQFFALTEPLWDELLCSSKFAVFRKTLAQCEKNLLDYRIESRLTFYVHILKYALWKGSPRWIEQTLSFVEEHASDLPSHLELDLEAVYLVRDYLEQREAFLNGHPIRIEMDKVLRDYCTRDEFEAEQSALAFEITIASAGESLLEAFPPDLDEAVVAAQNAWNLIEGQLAERLEIEANTDSSKQRQKSIRGLLRTLEVATDKSWTGRLWTLAYWSYLFAKLGAYLGAFAAMMMVQAFYEISGGMFVLFFLVAIVVAFVTGRVVDRFVLGPLWERFVLRQSRKCYDRIWRRELLQYLRQSYLPYGELLQLMLQTPSDQAVYAQLAVLHGQFDFALYQFGAAQQFLA